MRLTRLFRSLAIASLTLVPVACKSGPDLAVAVVQLTMPDDATRGEGTASIRVTEMVNLQLPVQDGTGYSWQLATPLASDSPVSFASSQRETAGAPEEVVIGGRTWYLLTFVGNTPGSAVVDLVYMRAWETAAQAAKTYRARIDVRK